jgi:glycosyltransferase involved in cell wall biosynthesis
VHPHTYVIVPVYNEAPVVHSTVDTLLETFDHVVCVDDGSSDGSLAALEGSGALVVRHPINLGQGAALQTGIDAALRDPNARLFVTFDSDGQHRIEDALRMLAILDHDEADVVFGSRFIEGHGGPTGMRRVSSCVPEPP